MKNLLLYSCLMCASYVFSGEIYFNHIKAPDGLSQISVLSIYQDKLGYLWFGTREGLNRYNGKDLKIIFSSENDRLGLPSNIINSIYGKDDNLYIHCGYHYLVSYNIRTDRFMMIDNNCQHVGQSSNGFWLSSGNQLKMFSHTQRTITYTCTMPASCEISAVFESSNRKLYVGTENGLYILDKNTIVNRLLPNRSIACIYEDSKQNIWIGTNGNGACCLHPDGSTDEYSAAPAGKTGFQLSNNIVRAFCEDNSGQIWIATFDGLNRLAPETGRISIYRHTGNKPTELSHNSIHTLYKDKQGTIWIGTYFGGVNYYNPEFNIYTRYYPDNTNHTSLNFPIVGKIAEDKNHNLWICTEGGGLNFLDRKTNTFQYHTAGGPNTISHNNLKSIHYNPDNHKLYIGTHLGGLNIYDINNNRFKHITTSTTENLPNNIIDAIVPYDNKLIILTQKGIVQLDPQTETIRPFPDDPLPAKKIGHNITNLYIDRNRNLWLALTEGGLLRYNLQSKNHQTYTHLFHNPQTSIGRNPVSCIYETRNGALLFSTLGSGLFKYTPETDSFQRYSVESHFLLSDFIYHINETRHGHLLLLTSNGVNLLDQHFTSLHDLNGNKGFPLGKINFGCGACVTADGRIFVGGTNGMVSFAEDQLNTVNTAYDLFFSDLSINNIPRNASESPKLLPESLPFLKEIRLKHHQTNILIQFATSNYIKPNSIPFEYKLTQFDDKWLPVENQTIRYSNLNPGKYTLHVREKHPVPPNRKPKQISLNITILPPFYSSTPAFTLYFIIIVILLWFFIRLNKMKFQLKTSLEYEIRENNRIQELNQIKLQFFTNISHEFRTPLTLIIAQLESLLQIENLPPIIHNKLGKVYKNTSHLRTLINELLDFRKQERDLLELQVCEMDIVAFARSIFNSFKDIAVQRQIEYTFFSSENAIPLWFDPIQMQKVLSNLLTNAFKYSGDRSAITLTIERRRPTVNINIIDSGAGIAEEDLPKIFNRFYQAKNSTHNPGTGIGLALSKGIVDLHHGTLTAQNNTARPGSTFTVALLTGSEHFTAEEKNSKNESASDFFKQSDIPQQTFFDEIKHAQATAGYTTSESTILIVEDNDEILNFLEEIFSPIYRVETAKDGFEGLEKVKTIQPDIVLSDIMMPKMSGKEMCIKIKSNFETSHIPVILITADTSEQQNLESLMAGADDYIVKPFNVKALISRCNNLVLSRKRMQMRYSKQIDDTTSSTIAVSKQDRELLEHATETVVKYLDNPDFNVNTFASEMALGRSKLYLKIKGITGMTPNEFILNIRLKKAAALLLSDPGLNVSDITYRLGFSAPRYFSKCFKDLFGISPIQYRKANGRINPGDEDETPPEP
jgi:signal transduction histidine kinase/ligand-binding sensor domain-containing protein/DNA-binding response OmpR family regulator